MGSAVNRVSTPDRYSRIAVSRDRSHRVSHRENGGSTYRWI
jgi:hypothetical protein